MSDIYIASYKMGRFIHKYGVYDPYGLKKLIYKLADLIRGKKRKKAEYVSTYIKIVDPKYLNLDHQKWYHPVSNKLFKSSVDDLYNEAINNCLLIFKETLSILENQKKIDNLYKLIPNISYITGLEINNKNNMQYFEY
jgi:hypothetical protein